ncbi:MAG TPA: serine/threonine-protein kinase, partial [Planctomycetota bacterium]|nr:serine/threonine-protein kinase [Planctomycetota bacterium]
MNPLDDPLRVSPEGRLFLARHKFCPWTGKPLAPLIGLRLGQFRIERAISTAGGFGVVYYARNVDQEEVEAAIKVLKPPHCYNKEMVRVFLYEAGLGRGLGVSQIPKIFNVAREPWPHITMEYIEGHTLQEEFELLHESFDSFENSTWIDVAEARGMMLGIALALQASHARDLHHRDLKPLNVMLTQDRNGPPANWVKVIDWGIAMKLDHAAGGEKQSSPSDTASIVEEKLGRMGSLPWMAPEQFSGQTDKRSDIYQFGLIAFELLTGESAYDPPEDELDLVQWQNIHKFRAPKEIRKIRKAVPRHLARVVERCLAKNPADRYADGAELAAALSVERLSLRIKMTIAFLTVTLLFAAIYIFNIDR